MTESFTSQHKTSSVVSADLQASSRTPLELSPFRRTSWVASRSVYQAVSVLVCLVTAASLARAQAIPTATADPITTGFQLPTTLGSLTYSVSGSETLTSGYTTATGWQPATGISGTAALISPSHSYPTSLVFAGGRFWSTSSQPSTTYLDLALSQVVTAKRWNFVLSDSAAYLPSTASAGLGGVPGTGDLGVPPVQLGIDPGQGILTNYSTRVSNAASLNAGRQINGKTSFQGSGSYSIFRFLNAPPGQSFNSNSYSASGGLSRQINGLSTISANYSYSRFTYLGGLPGFKTQTVSAGYNRKFSRRLTMNLQAGPQWTTGAFSTGAGVVATQLTAAAPTTTTLNAFIAANLSYSTRFAAYSLGYSRSANAGYGVTEGTRSDSVYFSGSKTIDRVWNVAATAAYSRSSTLGLVGEPLISPTTFVVSGQASRALARSLSVYGSYTVEKQNGTGSGLLFNVFSGSFQVIAFGLTYSHPPIHLGSR